MRGAEDLFPSNLEDVSMRSAWSREPVADMREPALNVRFWPLEDIGAGRPPD